MTNPLEELRRLSENNKQAIHIIDAGPSMATHFAFMKTMGECHKENLPLDLDDISVDTLRDSELDDDARRKMLCRLSQSTDPKAYNLLKEYSADAPEHLRDWASLATRLCGMSLEASILDVNNVYVTTGLGGKGRSLRYSMVLKANNQESFSEQQQTSIKNAFEYRLGKIKEAELEKVTFRGPLASLLVLLPLEHDMAELAKEVVTDCNIYGDFIDDNLFITNLKEIDLDALDSPDQLLPDELLPDNPLGENNSQEGDDIGFNDDFDGSPDREV